MSAADCCYGQRVRYAGQLAEIVDIVRKVDRCTAQIRLLSGHQRLRWVNVSELELP